MNYQEKKLSNAHARARLVITCLCTLTLFFILSCGKGKEETAREVVRPVKMLTIASSEDALVREFPGRVRAAQRVDMSFQVARSLSFPSKRVKG